MKRTCSRGRGRAALKPKQAKEIGGRTLLECNSRIQRQSDRSSRIDKGSNDYNGGSKEAEAEAERQEQQRQRQSCYKISRIAQAGRYSRMYNSENHYPMGVTYLYINLILGIA